MVTEQAIQSEETAQADDAVQTELPEVVLAPPTEQAAAAAGQAAGTANARGLK